MQGISFETTPETEEALSALLNQRLASLTLILDAGDKISLAGSSEDHSLESFSSLFQKNQPCYGIHASTLDPDSRIYCTSFFFTIIKF